VRASYPDDTLDEILHAPDLELLMAWLRSWPLVYFEAPYVMVHAGFCPSWSVQEALALSEEVSQALQGSERVAFLKAMYGHEPDCWSATLTGMTRLRVITNYFTRMRFCATDGRLLMSKKTAPLDCPADFMPWFKVPGRAIQSPIIFGHWSALQGETGVSNVFALDTGVVWGGVLTAMNLETGERTNQPAID
jgi:bis(5'-nucleosyl)-tetraphosphatase (symmetrical)